MIELLVVLTLLSLIVLLAADGIIRATQSDPLRTSQHRLQAAVTELFTAGRAVEVQLFADGLHDGHDYLHQPLPVSLSWQTVDGASCERWPIDASGTAPDLLVEMRHEQQHQRFLLSGLSGACMPAEVLAERAEVVRSLQDTLQELTAPHATP